MSPTFPQGQSTPICPGKSYDIELLFKNPYDAPGAAAPPYWEGISGGFPSVPFSAVQPRLAL
eukprot:1149490-Pelagomonas_calceolata.AAC.1